MTVQFRIVRDLGSQIPHCARHGSQIKHFASQENQILHCAWLGSQIPHYAWQESWIPPFVWVGESNSTLSMTWESNYTFCMTCRVKSYIVHDMGVKFHKVNTLCMTWGFVKFQIVLYIVYIQYSNPLESSIHEIQL